MATAVHFTPLQTRYAPENHIDMAMNGVGCRATARIMGVGLNTILRHLKTQAAVGNPRIQPGSDAGLSARNGRTVGLKCREAKSRQRWLFYAATGPGVDGCGARLVNARRRRWERLMSLLSAFLTWCDMDDGWLAAV